MAKELEEVKSKIYNIRGKQVMLDSDLAELYGVTTTRLNEQVRRNKERFPENFMFLLSREEFNNLISQNATSSRRGSRIRSYVSQMFKEYFCKHTYFLK